MDYQADRERDAALKSAFTDQRPIYSVYQVVNHTKCEIFYDFFSLEKPFSLDTLKSDSYLQWNWESDNIDNFLKYENCSAYIAVRYVLSFWRIPPEKYGFNGFSVKIDPILLQIG